MLPEILQHVDVFAVTTTTLNQSYVTLLCKGFNVIHRGFVKLHEFYQWQDPFVNVKKGHMTTEAACQ